MHKTLETKSIQAISNAIREGREMAGMDQSSVARASTFIHQPHVSRLESGTYVPTLPTLIELERIMGLPAGWILTTAGFVEGATQLSTERAIMVDTRLSTEQRKELLALVAEMLEDSNE